MTTATQAQFFLIRSAIESNEILAHTGIFTAEQLDVLYDFTWYFTAHAGKTMSTDNFVLTWRRSLNLAKQSAVKEIVKKHIRTVILALIHSVDSQTVGDLIIECSENRFQLIPTKNRYDNLENRLYRKLTNEPYSELKIFLQRNFSRKDSTEYDIWDKARYYLTCSRLAMSENPLVGRQMIAYQDIILQCIIPAEHLTDFKIALSELQKLKSDGVV